MLKVTPDALDFALTHVERFGDTDILPRAFEYEALRASWEDVRSYLAGQDLDAWSVGPTRKCLAPKGPLGYRIVTQLDPLDALLFTALVFEVGANLEQVRVPRDQHIVLSHRFEPDENGRLYSSDSTFENFRSRSLELAGESPEGWVVLTDIADFFPRLYSHPLENALNEAAPADHARVIAKFIKQWNYGVSYGVPVGPAASRLLAELCLADVDSALIGEGITYCRFSDDFRLFSPTRGRAMKHLTFLANVLHRNHGLTLQQSKTKLMRSSEFALQHGETAGQRQRREVDTNLRQLLDDFGGDTYGRIEYDELSPEKQAAVDALNLEDIVTTQIARDEPIDATLTGFALRRMGQVGTVTPELAELLLSNIDDLALVFRDVLSALRSTESPGSIEHEHLMTRVLSLLTHPALAHLDYYRVWLLTLFQEEHAAHLSSWQTLYSEEPDPFIRRELTLALGFAANQTWFRTRKQDAFGLGDWERRAYLRAASCLPSDEAKYWYNSIKPRLNPLEQWVVSWSKANPV